MLSLTLYVRPPPLQGKENDEGKAKTIGNRTGLKLSRHLLRPQMGPDKVREGKTASKGKEERTAKMAKAKTRVEPGIAGALSTQHPCRTRGNSQHPLHQGAAATPIMTKARLLGYSETSVR